jgi:glutamyl-Q tRNA(Asp) synthetase
VTGGGAPRADPLELPRAAITRYAPAPTGLLHLGHVVNALYTWGLAQAAGGTVVLRIEDHDRQRSRGEHETALLDDLDWLGFRPDRPSIAELRSGRPSAWRQSDSGEAHAAALDRLRDVTRVYACDCSRATFARFAQEAGRAWTGPGCPGRCVERNPAPDLLAERGETQLRAWLGDGEESWADLLVGPTAGAVAQRGDLVVRDRLGNWTYPFAVVVDDLRHAVDLVVRGEDLVDDTPRQIRLGRLLGRPSPPAFAHHPLVRRPDGTKLSKSAGDTAVQELREAGRSPAQVIGAAAAAIGLVPAGSDVNPSEAADLVVERADQAGARSATMRTT